MARAVLLAFVLIGLNSVVSKAAEIEDPVIRDLRDGNEDERNAAVRRLVYRRPFTKSHQHQLISVFADERQPSAVRTAAMQVILDVVGSPTEYEELLAVTVKDRRESIDVRLWASRGLFHIAAANAQNTQPLRVFVDLLRTSSEAPEIREIAMRHLSELHGLANEALKAMADILADRTESTDVRMTILTYMSSYMLTVPERYQELAEKVLQVARDEDESVHLRVQALKCFGEMTFTAIRRIKITTFKELSEKFSWEIGLLLLDTEEKRQVRDQAGMAMYATFFLDKRLIPPLIALLRSDDRYLHEEAAYLLSLYCGELSADCDAVQDAVPVLVALWKDPHEPAAAREKAVLPEFAR